MAFYLGRLGSMVVLPPPAPDMDTSPVWTGAVQRSITGTTTRDRIGRKRSWPLSWIALTAEQVAFIAAVDQGLVAGPLRYIDGLVKNRLSPQHSSGGTFKRSATGWTSSAGAAGWALNTATDPSWATLLDGGLTWAPPASTVATLRTSTVVTDRYPLITGEQVTLSCYAIGNKTAHAQLIPYDAAGVAGAAVTGAAVVLSGTPQRLSVSITPSSTQVSCVVGVDVTSTAGVGALAVTAWQLELGAAASQWVPGEGCPVVTAESMRDVSILPTYRAAGLTLLEV